MVPRKVQELALSDVVYVYHFICSGKGAESKLEIQATVDCTYVHVVSVEWVAKKAATPTPWEG